MNIDFVFNKKFIYNKRNSGITLISLVVTIIILLILAGISINMLSGNNSILQKATEAKAKTNETEEKEGVELATLSANIDKDGYQELNQTNLQNAIDNQFGIGKAIVIDNGNGTFTVSFIESKKDYNITSNGVENGIDWNKAIKEAKAPESQTTTSKSIIGIGTDGQPVNMDLWEYTLLDDGTYILNDSDTSTNNGYIGSFTNSGEIIGCIPELISIDNGKNYKKVTNLRSLFRGCSNLKIAPTIPKTVTNIMNLFHSCSNLEKAPIIPNGILIMQGTFYNCSRLENAPLIPNTVTNMQGTFQGCVSLEKVTNISNNAITMRATFSGCENISNVPDIPNHVEDMYMAFYNCKKLKNISKIPSSVTNMQWTFQNCYELSGNMIIEANITETTMKGCFLSSAQNEYLTLKCSESVYNLFYDENRTNKIKASVCQYGCNIVLEKI